MVDIAKTLVDNHSYSRFEIFHCESKPMKPEATSSKAMPVTKPMALPATRALNSHTLLGGQDEIAIRHDNETYRLRRTRQSKLILTK